MKQEEDSPNENQNPDQDEVPANKSFFDEEGNLHITVTHGGPNPTTSVIIMPKSDEPPRSLGIVKGEVVIKDSFFDPLPDAVLDFFDPNPTPKENDSSSD